jgi:hypothetical protein
MHVKTGTRLVSRPTETRPDRRDELAEWGRRAVARIEGFYAEDGHAEAEVRFTFKGCGDLGASPSSAIGK